MYRYPNGSILADADALDEELLVEKPQAREEQIKQLWFCLGPLEKRKNPLNCWIYGEPGTGKTSVTRFVLREVESVTRSRVVHVNCWEKNTFYAVLDRIIIELKILGPEKPATSQKLELLQKYLREKGLVVVLDDVDRPSPFERNAILYNLCNLSRLGLVCISRSAGTMHELDERIKSRLNAVRIEFPKYTLDDLLSILESRAQQALVKGTWERETLATIAELARGDARIAVQMLKNAGYHAQKEFSKAIGEQHVLRAWSDIRAANTNHLLNRLTEHHRFLYGLVKERRKILSNELWDAYVEKCWEARTQPISRRTYPDYINELRNLGLVNVKRVPLKGKVREVSVV